MSPATRWVASAMLAPAVGLLCFLLPIAATGGLAELGGTESVSYVSRLFESVVLLPTGILLILAGFGLRRIAGRGTWALPFLLIVPFPIATAVDVALNPYTHNLLPFELAIQLACVLPGLLGTLAAALLARRYSNASVSSP